MNSRAHPANRIITRRALNHIVAVDDLLGQKNRVAMTARSRHIPTPEALELELAFLEYWLK